MSILDPIRGWFGGGVSTGPAKLEGNETLTHDPFRNVGAETAANLATVFACQHLRAETIGTLPAAVYNADRTVASDHPLTELIKYSPNAHQTGPEFWSLQTALVDMYGNAYCQIKRDGNNRPTSLIQLDSETTHPYMTDRGSLRYRTVDDPRGIPADDVLHLKGFTMRGLVGASRLTHGRRLFASQLRADEQADLQFRNGLKTGGMFKITAERDMTQAQRDDWERIQQQQNLPENRHKWLTLVKGIEPVTGLDMRVTPAEAELLASRSFGIEEICRLFNVPPQLIGHTDKASSWASSIENINLHYLTYSVNPTLVRMEHRVRKQLMSPGDRARGMYIKFNVQGLERTDSGTRYKNYEIGKRSGFLSTNDILEKEDKPAIEGGDAYEVHSRTTTGNNK